MSDMIMIYSSSIAVLIYIVNDLFKEKLRRYFGS